jgi:hypothetical protein
VSGTQGGGTATVSVTVSVVCVVEVAVRDRVVDSVIVATNGCVTVMSVTVVEEVLVATVWLRVLLTVAVAASTMQAHTEETADGPNGS